MSVVSSDSVSCVCSRIAYWLSLSAVSSVCVMCIFVLVSLMCSSDIDYHGTSPMICLVDVFSTPDAYVTG